MAPDVPPTGTDTRTGTDPDARYDRPGYEDKSLGQAVNQDQELADQLVEESGGDLEEAGRRFAERSAGAPALARQGAPGATGGTGGTGTSGSADSSDRSDSDERTARADRANGEPDAQG